MKRRTEVPFGACTQTSLLVQFGYDAAWAEKLADFLHGGEPHDFGGLILLHQFVQQLGLRSRLAHTVRFPSATTGPARPRPSWRWYTRSFWALAGSRRRSSSSATACFSTSPACRPTPIPRACAASSSATSPRQGWPIFSPCTTICGGSCCRLRRPSPPWSSTSTRPCSPCTATRNRPAVGFDPKKRGRPSYLPLLCVEGQTGDCWAAELPPREYPRRHGHPPALGGPRGAKLPAECAPPCGCVQTAPFTRRAHRGAGGAPGRLHNRGPADAPAPAARWRLPSTSRWVAGSARPSSRTSRRADPGRGASRSDVRCLRSPRGSYRFFRLGAYVYRVIVTNLDLTPLHVWRFYNVRAEAELVIRR